MDSYESTRRSFIRKLGLTMGVAAMSGAASGAKIVESNIEFRLSTEQQNFMDQYEVWMDQFVEVIKARKTQPNDLEINKKLMQLSEQHQEWQKEVKGYMEDENFARHYMVLTQRMTDEIN
jgi:hypothetical protein